jgi:hypothetical protein
MPAHSNTASPRAGSPTAFVELNQLLRELVERAGSILDGNLVGAYLTGSFALGAADLQSDCDFLIVTENRVSKDQERALRELHNEIPARDGHWTHHLEGSYAPKAELETLAAIGREWLCVDHGWREMQWSAHCNTEDVRWTLRERGITLAGPVSRKFVQEVPAEALRSQMRLRIETFLTDLLSWTTFDIAWTQRYAVATLCRMLYTLTTAQVASKQASLDWARQHLGHTWDDLIQQVMDDRLLPWDDPPRPGSVDTTIGFAQFAKERAASSLLP